MCRMKKLTWVVKTLRLVAGPAEGRAGYAPVQPVHLGVDQWHVGQSLHVMTTTPAERPIQFEWRTGALQFGGNLGDLLAALAVYLDRRVSNLGTVGVGAPKALEGSKPRGTSCTNV